MKIKLGLIGPGRIGKAHAETLAPRIPSVEVAALADADLHTNQPVTLPRRPSE